MRLTTISLSSLLARNPEIAILRIRSIDPELYIAEVEFDEVTWRVTNDEGEPLSFRGVSAAKKPFSPLRIQEAYLVHESAYDEMVGQPAPVGGNLMQVKIAPPHD